MSYRNQQFEQEFESAFNGRFRIRWSDKRQEYHIEQKLTQSNPALIPPVFRNPETGGDEYDTYSDAWIRARDGYFFVMAVRNGTKMPCPVCGMTVDVPELVTAESFCHYCKVMGRDGRYVAAYYPLNHILIEHIKTIDPLTDGPTRSRQRIRDAQLKKEKRDQQKALDDADAMVRFNQSQVMNTPMSGFGTHKTHQREDERIEVARLYR